MESTKTQAKDAMSEVEDSGKEESSKPSQRPAAASDTGGGYFHIYKKGQGYWTRMGTVAAAGLLGLLTGNFIYVQSSRWLEGIGPIPDFMAKLHLQDPRGSYLVVLIFAIVYAWFAFHVMNRPTNVDFLVATDSEMKKVNWTTRKELMGSTKVVIGFVFVMAIVLFFYDLFFQFLFYFLGVLKTAPFGIGQH